MGDRDDAPQTRGVAESAEVAAPDLVPDRSDGAQFAVPDAPSEGRRDFARLAEPQVEVAVDRVAERSGGGQEPEGDRS